MWRYNHESWYVDAVLADAARYGEARVPPVGSAPELLANPRLVLTDRARSDPASGLVDARVVALLGAMTSSHTIGVSVFKTGHATFVAGTTSVSNHFFGRAVDIYMVNGEPVSASSAATAALIAWLGLSKAPRARRRWAGRSPPSVRLPSSPTQRTRITPPRVRLRRMTALPAVTEPVG